MDLLVGFEYAIIFATSLLLLWRWIELVRAEKPFPFTLIAVSASSLWMLLSLLLHQAFGPFYSTLRASVLLTNLVIVIVCAVLAAAMKSQRNAKVITASVLLGFVWFFTLSIAYAV